MWKDVLFNKRFFTGLVFLTLLIVGSIIWYESEIRKLRKSEAKTQVFLDALKKDTLATKDGEENPDLAISQSETTTAPLVVEENEMQTLQQENFIRDDQSMETAEPLRNSKTGDIIGESNLINDFPEVPEGFPSDLIPVWVHLPNYQKGDMYGHELMYRVLIKLWNQGDHDFVNGIYSHNNGRVYPLCNDVLYVEWDDEVVNGKTIRFPVATTGAMEYPFTIEEQITGSYLTKYPGLKFVDWHQAGYDPETFLSADEK